ncbi:lipase secretion chaperone [Litoribrevibacter albus]|uniref:Lipase chaperone n=1 Tax=Litoribrevibacter albus TaxID=1473156 RepID=A0AA37W8Y7_9GAMM|nr:lipase secretion chaperone [Litoribrevibacter albus]GLQ32021.1 hypothetical protein GCM10007876_25000 [Litoribrevibacter albus]
MKKLYLIITTTLIGVLVGIATLPSLLKNSGNDIFPLDATTPTVQTDEHKTSPIKKVQQLNIKDLPSSPSEHYKAHPDQPRPAFVRLAPSLNGTEIDGILSTDGNNQLVLNLNVRDTFDYFLNTIGEVSPETAISEIKALINASLPEPAKTQAINALEDYLTYKAAAIEVLNRPLDKHAQQTPEFQYQILEQSLNELQQLRQQYLSNELNHAFYSEENAFAQYTLNTMKVQLDDTLTMEEKTQSLILLEEALPETIRTSMDQIATSQAVAVQAESLYESGNRDAYEAHLREYYSEDIVEQSLADFDQQQAFDQTYITYREALNQYDESELSQETLESVKQDLRNQFFEGHDRLIAKTRDNLEKL